MAAEGYPNKPKTGTVIEALDQAKSSGATVFHASTAWRDGRLVAAGGRVLSIVGSGLNVTDAHRRAYRAVDRLHWDGGFCRRDIGWRALARERADASAAEPSASR
jgi:phosphoribosylamine---glycine ligase